MTTKKIGCAKQSGSSVNVYDINGSFLFSKSGTLMGFTCDTVAIQSGSSISVYDANGSFKYSK